MTRRRVWPRGIAILLAGFLSAVAVHNCAIDYLGRNAPGKLIDFAPQSAAAIVQRSARMASATGDAKQFEWATRLGLEALRKEPLSPEPLVMRGMAMARLGDIAAADRLIGRALAIAPANGAAHSWFMYRALLAGEPVVAARQAVRVMEIMPSERVTAIAVLVDLAADPEVRRVIRTGGLSPFNLAAVATAASRTALPGRALEEMLPDAAGEEGGVRQLRSRMLREGDFAGLRRIWERSLGRTPPASPADLYDGDFRGLPGGPPFNWTLSQSDAGAAKRITLDRGPAGTALAVTLTGLGGGTFAQQLMMLAPGAYRLTLVARTDPPARAGEAEPLVLALRCARPVTMLASLPLAPGPEWKPLSQTFTVPGQGCAAQEVVIQAPQLGGGRRRLLVTNITIRKIA